jgi:hypothetical protein
MRHRPQLISFGRLGQSFAFIRVLEIFFVVMDVPSTCERECRPLV